ncbi:MAG TPA: sugar ABC transporter substrate-binding protein [Conexibacter sp.]|nr:sugar ABC transporter substrate-binding protein [Conexibacter sp.]
MWEQDRGRWPRRLTLLSVAAALVALTATGCGSSDDSGDSASTGTQSAASTTASGEKDCSIEGKKIQFVAPLKSNPTMQVMAAGFEQRAEELGFDGTVLMSDDADPQKILALGQQAMTQGSDGMVIPPYDAALYPFIKQASDQGIPIITTHSSVPDSEDLGMKQDIHPDPAQYGAEAARAIGEQIGGRGTVAVTQGGFNPIENAAAESFAAAMKEQYPDVKVLKSQEEGFEPAAAISKAVSVLQSDDTIAAAYSTTGGGPKTWAGAADQAKRDLTIIGMDYTRPNLDLVRSGKVYAVVAQPIYEEHADAVDALKAVICGEEVEAEVSAESPLVTQDNVEEYFDLLDRTGT